jgi:hypothetical protein
LGSRDSVPLRPVSKPAVRYCSRLPTVSRKSFPLRVILPFGNSSSELLHFDQRRSLVFRRELRLSGVSALFTASPTCIRSERISFETHSNVEISQIPTPFRPQALSASRRFSPQAGLQAYFIPQPCSGPILFRGSFSPHSRTISSIAELFPPCR